MRTFWTAAAVVALAVTTARYTAAETVFDGADGMPLLAWTALAWLFFGLAWWSLRALPSRTAAALVVAGTLAVSAAALAGPPNTSTDSARYAWDGIVTKAGISPWEHVPAADALDPVRQPWLYPAPISDADGTLHCVGARVTAVRSVPDGDLLCTTLNRPGVPTIYPPVAQGWFALVRGLVPDTATWWPMQVAGAVLVLVVTLMLMRLLRGSGRDPRRAAWWGWSPFVASEAVTNSHIDTLGVMFLVVATGLAVPGFVAVRWLVVGRGRALLVGAVVGLAVAVKVVPGVAALPLARRRPLTTITGGAIALVAVYGPAVLASGWSVVGYLPGYLEEQGYDSGSGFTLTSLVAPGHWSLVLSAGLLLVIAVLQWWWTDPEDPWNAQLLGGGAMLLVLSSPYPWYALVLVPFIALTGRWEWYAVPLLMTAHLLVPRVAVMNAVIPVAVVVVAVGTIVRHRRRRADHPDTLATDTVAA